MISWSRYLLSSSSELQYNYSWIWLTLVDRRTSPMMNNHTSAVQKYGRLYSKSSLGPMALQYEIPTYFKNQFPWEFLRVLVLLYDLYHPNLSSNKFCCKIIHRFDCILTFGEKPPGFGVDRYNPSCCQLYQEIVDQYNSPSYGPGFQDFLKRKVSEGWWVRFSAKSYWSEAKSH